jgi:hypothetical protein
MSGGDSSGSSISFGMGGEDDDCSAVTLDTSVQSPSTTEPFAPGNIYGVRLGPNASVPTVQLTRDADAVGAIRPTPPLLRCLRKGVTFTAEVTSVNGGDIRVHISA